MTLRDRGDITSRADIERLVDGFYAVSYTHLTLPPSDLV